MLFAKSLQKGDLQPLACPVDPLDQDGQVSGPVLIHL